MEAIISMVFVDDIVYLIVTSSTSRLEVGSKQTVLGITCFSCQSSLVRFEMDLGSVLFTS